MLHSRRTTSRGEVHVKRRMKGTVAILLAYLLPPLTAAHAQNEQDKTTGGAQRLTTGRITKIDTKKRTLKVRTQADNPTSSTPRQPQGSGRRGGRRRSGGILFPGPGGTGGGRQPTSTTKDQGKEFKVTVTDKTVFKRPREQHLLSQPECGRPHFNSGSPQR